VRVLKYAEKALGERESDREKHHQQQQQQQQRSAK